jgi:hypothetical protein
VHDELRCDLVGRREANRVDIPPYPGFQPRFFETGGEIGGETRAKQPNSQESSRKPDQEILSDDQEILSDLLVSM